MIIHDGQGENDHGETDDASIAKRILRDQLGAVKPLIATFEQIEAVYDGVGHGTRLGLLLDAYKISRQAGDIFHELARLIDDLRRSEGG